MLPREPRRVQGSHSDQHRGKVDRDPFREMAGADGVSKPSLPTTHVFSGHTNQSPAQAQPAEGRKLSLGSLILPVMSENLG